MATEITVRGTFSAFEAPERGTVHASIAYEGPAMGAQAGEARLREVVEASGFQVFRRATETPFNLVLEARP